MLRQFTRSQNLRAFLQPENLPASIHGLLPAYHKVFNSDLRGTLLHDTLTYDENYDRKAEIMTWSQREEQRLKAEVYDLLMNWVNRFDVNNKRRRSAALKEPCSARAFMRTQIKWLGQTFHTHAPALFGVDKVVSNSLVIFPDGQGDGTWSAGRIRKIFSHRHPNTSEYVRTFFVIEEYAPLRPSDIPFDIYRRFPILGGRIFYNKFKGSLVLRSTDEILGHFGHTHREFEGIEEDCIHVYPFIKVSKIPCYPFRTMENNSTTVTSNKLIISISLR